MAGRKKSKSFRRSLSAYMTVLLILGALSLLALWLFLARYQAGIDRETEERLLVEQQLEEQEAIRQAPQRAFESYLQAMNGEAWARLWFEAHPDSVDDPQAVTDYMTELFSSETLRCWKAPDYSELSPRYLVKDAGRALAAVTLSGSGKEWVVSQTELLLEGTESAELLAPEGCAVLCNGREYTSPPAERLPLLLDMADDADKLINPVNILRYKLENQLFPVTLEAAAPAGRSMMSLGEDSLCFMAEEAQASEIRAQAERFVRSLLYYYMMGQTDTGANMWSVLNQVQDDSPAWHLIRDSYIGVVWDATYHNATYDIQPGDVAVLADNCLAVDVKYHSEGTIGSYTNVADGTYRVYFLDSGAGYGVYLLAYV